MTKRKILKCSLIIVLSVVALSPTSYALTPGDEELSPEERALLKYIGMLQTGTEIERREACYQLGKIGDIQAVEYLLNALNDDTFSVHRAAITALGAIGDTRAVEPLVEKLRSHDVWIRKAAIDALLQFGSEAVNSILPLLSSESPGVRESAVTTLGLIGDPQTTEAIKALLQDPDTQVSLAASNALAHLDQSSAVSSLIEKSASSDFFVQTQAKQAILEIGSPALPALIAGLESDNIEIRRSCADILGLMKDEEAILPLINALSDSDEVTRKMAAVALGAIGEPALTL